MDPQTKNIDSFIQQLYYPGQSKWWLDRGIGGVDGRLKELVNRSRDG